MDNGERKKATGPLPGPLTLMNASSTGSNRGSIPNEDQTRSRETTPTNSVQVDKPRTKKTDDEPPLECEKLPNQLGGGLGRRRLSWAVNEKSSIVNVKKTGQDEKTDDDGGDAAGLRADLMRLMIGDEHLLKVKVQYLDERTALNLQRPVSFQEVEQYFQNKYSRLLNFYYTTSTRELMIQVRNQQDMDHVIQLHERTGLKHRMRLILSQKREQSEQSCMVAPPLGMYHSGIQESALSDTSSIWSMISSSSAKRTPGGTPLMRGMGRWAEEEGGGAGSVETPRPPSNWREGRCLGRGAFGQVFVCLDVDTGEQLVVKKIFVRGNSRQQRCRVMATLENELNLLGTLRHPNIVQYLGVVERPDCVNIFMELMAGGSIKDQISEYGALGEQMSVHFTAQILHGLVYLHARDIVHRDIKPANILRHTRAHIKIGDFGSAKFLQTICSEQGVDIQGTPHYTAPEIIRDNRRFESKSDIWSVGITLVEMLTTRTPWSGIEPAAVHLRIAFESPQLALPDGLSRPLVAAIGRMLRRETEERPDAGELLKMRPFNGAEPGGGEEEEEVK